MGGKVKPSPFSTGGGGYEYERMVGATYLAAMVCGGAAPGVDGTVTQVRFQQRNAGHLLDDLVVVSDGDDGVHKLSLQVKYNLSIGATPGFKDAIAGCWRMFTGGDGVAFDRSADRMGIVVPHVTDNARRHCLPVLETARDSGDAATFWSSLKHGGHSRRRLEFANLVRDAAANSAGTDATDDDVWRFLRLLHIIVLDMDGPGAVGRAFAVRMCHDALAELNEGEAAMLFDALRGVAAGLAPAGVSIGTAALRGRLSAFGLRGHARTEADARRLDEHSQEVMTNIKKTIADEIALGRARLVDMLEDTAKANAVTVIYGDPFAGKSALARLFAEAMSGRGTVMFFGAAYLGEGSLEAFLRSLGVQGSLEDILETDGTAPHRYVVIDGFDRLPYEPEKAQVAKSLLAAVSGYNARAAASASGGSLSWKIIVTTRNTEMEDAVNTVERSCGGIRAATLEVGSLDDGEIDEVRRQAPYLGRIITGRLGRLLSLPGYLDMIAGWGLARPGGAPNAIGEGWLFDRFWKEAVLRRNGMREGRGHWRIREKLLMDAAERACTGRPPADLHDLDPDAVDGLLTEALARKIGTRLVAAHDVIEDYALAKLIECAESRRLLFEKSAGSRRLVRPLRICAAKMLEVDASAGEWESLLEDCRLLAGGEVWARECLLGAADSDAARPNLDVINGALLKDGGALLARLLAALPSAFLRDNPRWDQAAGEGSDAKPGLHPAYYKLPMDERFAPVLSFALDNMDGPCDAAAAEFIRTAAMWARNGKDRALKRRIAEYAAQRTDWLSNDEEILGRNYGESDEAKGLAAAIILYSSDSAPDLAREFISGNPSIIHNEHFKRGLIDEHGWAYLCKFLPDVAVDVLSRTMCTGPAALGTLKDIPVASDDGWTVLPSPLAGPFYPLLTSHSEHGIDLVHRLLNHVTEQWRRAQEEGSLLRPPRSPLPQTVRLESGPVDVYGDEDAFAWCGHTRRAPDLVASALMALEMWLDGEVERGTEPVAALFDRILQATSSAAVVGVCCAVALRHPDRSAEAMLPILANPAFWIMDAERRGADMKGIDIVRMHARISGRGQISKRLYESAMQHAVERCKLGHLATFVHLLLDGSDEARTKMQDALGTFPNRVPVFFKDEVNDKKTMGERRRYCEVCSERAYRDSYKPAPTSEGPTGIVFDMERFLTDDEKNAERQSMIYKKILDFTTWSYTFIEKNKVGPNFTIKPALEYAEQITDDGFLSSLPNHYAVSALNSRANLVGAMIIHRWDEAVEMGVADACLKYLEDTAGTIDPRIESRYPYGADQVVAFALPHCHLRGGRGRGTRNAIRKFADAHDIAVIEFLMRGLCALWAHEDKLVLECIAKARRRFCSARDRFGRPYTDWAGYAAVLPALHGVPVINSGAERRLERMLDGMLDDTIAEFTEFEGRRGYGGAHPAFRGTWCPGFFVALESCVAARPALRDAALDKIASSWVAAPPLLESFMRWTILGGMRAGRKKALLAAWKRLLPGVIGSGFAAGHCHNARVKKSILSLLIFDDTRNTINNEDRFEVVGEFTDEISTWCAALAGNNDAVDAVASLLDDAPDQLLLSHGIGWLWQILQPADMAGLSSGAVKMLSHLLHRASACGRQGGALPALADKYAWLVDRLVVLNDPVAESLRDEGKNPYADASGRGRR